MLPVWNARAVILRTGHGTCPASLVHLQHWSPCPAHSGMLSLRNISAWTSYYSPLLLCTFPLGPLSPSGAHNSMPGLAQLLMDEVDLGESTHGGSHDHVVYSMQAIDGPTGQVPGAKPSPNNMPVSWYNLQDIAQVLWAKVEGIERQTSLDLLKRTWKTSLWVEEDDEKMTLPDPQVPLVYSLHYAQQGRQDWEDELPPETMNRMKKQEKRKRNFHADKEVSETLETMNLASSLSKLIQKYQEVFGVLASPLSCKKLVEMDLKLKPEFEGSVVRRHPHHAPKDQNDQMEHHIQECIDAVLVEECKHRDYPRHCSPCLLEAKPGSTAMRLVVD